jgi:hypothetical protein
VPWSDLTAGAEQADQYFQRAVELKHQLQVKAGAPSPVDKSHFGVQRQVRPIRSAGTAGLWSSCGARAWHEN